MTHGDDPDKRARSLANLLRRRVAETVERISSGKQSAEWWRQRLSTILSAVGERAVDLMVHLLVMVLVERAYGPEGLGVFVYLAAVVVVGSELADLGVSRWTELRCGSRDTAADAAVRDGTRALIAGSALFAAVMLAMAFWYREHFATDARPLIYLLAIPAVGLRNHIQFKIAVMHGMGKHTPAHSLKNTKRLIFLLIIWVCQFVMLPVPLLIFAFVISDGVAAFRSRPHLRLPGARALMAGTPVGRVFRQSREYLFADDVLDTLIYVNYLILGLYVSSEGVGAFAQAMIFVKAFLILPVALQPIMRERYVEWLARGAQGEMRAAVERVNRAVFALQALLALFGVLYFEEILNRFLHSDQMIAASFRCFVLVLPGLLLITPLLVMAPLYEAAGRVRVYRGLILGIAAVNLLLNIYLVPFAGINGAAVATGLGMIALFSFFGAGMRREFEGLKSGYLPAGAAIYLTYTIIEISGIPTVLTWAAAPPLMLILFWLAAYFDPALKGAPR